MNLFSPICTRFTAIRTKQLGLKQKRKDERGREEGREDKMRGKEDRREKE